MRPVLFSIGPVEIHSYTVCMLSAFLIGGWLTYREAKRRMRLTEATLMIGSIGLVGAVVGANSLVNRDIPAGEVWVGTPARFLKKRA